MIRTDVKENPALRDSRAAARLRQQTSSSGAAYAIPPLL